MNYPQAFHSDRAFCPRQFARQVHAHTLPLEWSCLEGERQQPAAPSWFCFPLDLQRSEQQQFPELFLLHAELPLSRWRWVLIPGAVLGNPRNTFPNLSLTFPRLVQLQRWVDSQSPGLRRDHHPMQTSTIQCGSKMLLAAATPVANQDLLDPQTP